MRCRSILFAAPMVAAFVSVALPIHTSAATITYQLAVTESATTVTTSQGSPSFRATLVPPADDPGLNPANFYISVGSMNEAGTPTTITPPYGLYVSPGLSLAAGSYQVVAKYQSPNHGLLTSAPITLTVVAASPPLTCGAGGSYNYAPGAAVTVTVGGVTGGTFTVTFQGPVTVTSPPQQLNSNGQFTVSAPTVPGNYAPTCTFGGSTIYSPATAPFSNRILTVSASHQVRGITLYTNPYPLRASTLTTWQLVVAGQPGLPPPTGNVSVTVGTYFMRPLVALGANGIVSFTSTSPPADPSQGIQVVYMGDTNYAAANVMLYTTRPIPGATTSTSPPTAAGSPSSSPAEASRSTSAGGSSPSANTATTPVAAAVDAANTARRTLGTLGILALIVTVGIGSAAAAVLIAVRWRASRR